MLAPDRDADQSEIRGLIGVYNARGSLRGELSYVAAKLGGRASCALCDITHRGLRSRRDFDDVLLRLPVPFEFVHLDARSEEVRAASSGVAPCVLARTATGLHLLLDSKALADCEGAPTALLYALRETAQKQTLRWPATL